MKTVKTGKKLDIKHTPDLEAELNSALSESPDELVIDMVDTVYVSSIALRTLLKAQKSANKMGINMVICNVSETVMEVFDITGFSGVFTLEES